MAYAPGEVWAYNTGGSMVLGAIVEEATGRDLLLFAREALFDPIGIGDVYWEHMADGRYESGGSLHMTPRDMARLGYLMLHQGRWDGKRILSANWVARSTTAYYQADGPVGYGYQWWILPEEQGFAALGALQQRIYILPKADMVAVFTANLSESSLYSVDRLLYTFVLPACTDLPPTPAAPAAYDAHGITFEYPARFWLQEAPIPGHTTVSDSRGMIQITSTWEPLEIVLVLWHTVDANEDARSFLEAYLAGLQEEAMALTPGESGEGQKDGHPMALRFSEATPEGGTLPIVSAAWICEESGRAFGVTYLTTAEMTSDELQAALEQYLEGLTCH
jgi:hypothetical protein